MTFGLAFRRVYCLVGKNGLVWHFVFISTKLVDFYFILNENVCYGGRAKLFISKTIKCEKLRVCVHACERSSSRSIIISISSCSGRVCVCACVRVYVCACVRLLTNCVGSDYWDLTPCRTWSKVWTMRSEKMDLLEVRNVYKLTAKSVLLCLLWNSKVAYSTDHVPLPKLGQYSIYK